MKKYSLKKEAKLLKTDEFSSVFNFKNRYTTEFVVFHFKSNEKMHARLGLVVGKKVEKSSVMRNYMRRVLRELFRTNELLQGFQLDIIIRVQKSFNPLHFKHIELALNKFLQN